MDQLLQNWVEGEIWAATLGITIAILLIVALRFVLPADEKGLVRQPIFFLILHIIGLVLLHSLSAPVQRRPVAAGAFLLLLASIGRSLVLLVLDVFVGRKLLRPAPKIFRDIGQGLVYILVLFAGLRASGVELGSILTTSALITAVIGLSLQETLGNLFAGVAIQLQRPFDVGDWIQFDGEPKHVGKVVEINWRATRLHTLDEVEVVVPNGQLAKAAIRNYSRPSPYTRRSVYVQAAYDIPTERVRDVILGALKNTPGVLEQPPPTVVTNLFADSGIDYWVRFYTLQFERRDLVDGLVRDRIWYALRRSRLEIPYPHRTVQVHTMSEERATEERERAIARRARSLRRVNFLDVLTAEQRNELASLTTSQLYAAGEDIVRQGDTSHELFVLESGEVQVMVDHPGANGPLEVARLTEGKFFGEMALVTGEKRTATVRATRECELIVIGHKAFHTILEKNPELAERISTVLAERQIELEEHAAQANSDRPSRVSEKSLQLLSRIKQFFSLR